MSSSRPPSWKWSVCLLLLFATVLLYMDRQTLTLTGTHAGPGNRNTPGNDPVGRSTIRLNQGITKGVSGAWRFFEMTSSRSRSALQAPQVRR
jgi:hypothetical protein